MPVMRLGLVTSEFPPDIGGVETYAYQLSAELGRRPEYSVTVYAPPSAAKISAPPGVTVKPWLRSCQALDWARLRSEPIDVWHALSAPHAWLALTGRPTVVSVHGNDFLAPYALTARPGLNVPLVQRWRPQVWHYFDRRWRDNTERLIARALPRAAAIIANSHYTARVLSQTYSTVKTEIVVAGVGVDAGFFTVANERAQRRTHLLTVSRLSEPRKNVDLVIRALSTLRGRFDFDYTIVGDGKQRAALEQLVTTFGMGSLVHFAGSASPDQLRAHYAQADLFVLTSSIIPGSHEGFGIVYLEAAASGVPCLAARLAGAVEAVSDRVSGFFVDEPSTDAISVALASFMAGTIQFDPERCRSFARRFEWPRIADVITATYPATVLS